MRSLWADSIGRPPAFSLEARIFNVICIVSAFTAFANIFLNYLLGIPQLAIVMAIVFAIASLCYYYSRFKMILNSFIIVYMIVMNMLLIVNYKYNSGINGPTLLIFMFSYFLTISIVPKKQYWFWISLNLIIVFTLLITEYLQPGFIKSTYTDSKSRLIDTGYTYICLVFFIFLVTTSIRKSYHTEQKLVEQKAAELEDLNDTKNKLFSILAHDLRAPLSSIQNYLEILSDYKLDESEKLSIKRDLLTSTQNTQQMLTNLLFWSKAQMDGLTVNLGSLNVKETLKDTLTIHKGIASEKGIRLVDQLKKDVNIIADADMLQLIVRNLINNAIKFTAPGGEITVSADVTGNDCRILIKDNGLGIPNKQQKDIFSLKVGSTFGTKNEKGVGLGLLLCREFTELQNGKITFESFPGVGTTFYLSFKSRFEEMKDREPLNIKQGKKSKNLRNEKLI